MHVALTTFAESGAAIRKIRDAVFGAEQGVPRELDWDGNDPHAVQVLAVAEDGTPVGTGRLLPDGRIGRLAVLQPWRSQGIGGRMLEGLVAAACARGLTLVYLHAQVPTVAFYARHGFQRDGTEFVEAGIRHVHMTRRIETA
jgi:predicted GNAT family N-acyltransferase